MPTKRKSAFFAAQRDAQKKSEEIAPERLGTQDTEPSSTQTPNSPSTQTAKRSDAQDTRRSSAQELKRSGTQTTKRLVAQVTNSSSAQASDEPKWKRQTVYLYPDLYRWVRHHIADTDQDISNVVNEALRQYRARLEGQET
jgi:hypothetical protein